MMAEPSFLPEHAGRGHYGKEGHMTRSLPAAPSLRYLQEEAKDLLKAQRQGDAGACPTLRLLRRFQKASDEQLLSSHVALHEAQLALALDYRFKSWADLRHHLRTAMPRGVCSLNSVALRCRQEIPEYAGAGVPMGIVAALNHAGAEMDFMDFTAATGWAFSFGYKYDDISPAFMAVRGNPRDDGPTEVFGFLPTRLGYGYAMARTGNVEELWPFVVKHVDAGTPIMSEHMDGGLITAYRQQDGKRQIFFDGTAPGAGWLDADKLQPYAVYVLVREREPEPPEQVLAAALGRAAQKGSEHAWHGVPQGMSALKAYRADVADAGKDFAKCGEWFCWAAFERLMARKCAAVWLASVVPKFKGKPSKCLKEAASHYGRAWRRYEEYRAAAGAGEPTVQSLQQRARTPERIAAILPILDRAINEEAAGLRQLESAETLLK
jgi:hypothetical protein